MLEPARNAREGALRGEGADVQLVDHRFPPRRRAPVLVRPLEGLGVDHLARAVDVLRVAPRCRIGHQRPAVDRGSGSGCRLRLAGGEVEPAVGALLERQAALARPPPTPTPARRCLAAGAHRRKRTPPSGSTCAPKGMSWRRRLIGTRSRAAARASVPAAGRGCPARGAAARTARRRRCRAPSTRLFREGCRQLERNRLVMRVEEQHEVVVGHQPAAPVAPLDGGSREIEAEAARERPAPLRLGHLAPVGSQPDDLPQTVAGDRVALQEAPAAEYRVAAAQGDQSARRIRETPACSASSSQSSQESSLSWQ